MAATRKCSARLPCSNLTMQRPADVLTRRVASAVPCTTYRQREGHVELARPRAPRCAALRLKGGMLCRNVLRWLQCLLLSALLEPCLSQHSSSHAPPTGPCSSLPPPCSVGLPAPPAACCPPFCCTTSLSPSVSAACTLARGGIMNRALHSGRSVQTTAPAVAGCPGQGMCDCEFH